MTRRSLGPVPDGEWRALPAEYLDRAATFRPDGRQHGEDAAADQQNGDRDRPSRNPRGR